MTGGGAASAGILELSGAPSPDAGALSVLILEELLAPPVLDWVRTCALGTEERMHESPVVTGGESTPRVDVTARRSRVLWDPPRQLVALFRSQIHRVLPDVLLRMDHDVVVPTAIDVQLTVHEDGGHFSAHADASDGVHPDRQLSYVYFCHGEPAAFVGGLLRIREGLGERVGEDRWVEVGPEANRLVVFASRFRHEVTEVRVPSGRFADGRFTVNGWVCW